MSDATALRFAELVDRCGNITSGDVEAFRILACSEARRFGRRRDHRAVARELHKLALELGVDDWTARAVYDAAMTAR